MQAKTLFSSSQAQPWPTLLTTCRQEFPSPCPGHNRKPAGEERKEGVRTPVLLQDPGGYIPGAPELRGQKASGHSVL